MKRETLTLPMSDIKLNDSNPRVIKDKQMKRLIKSIQDFPEMTELRPIVVDENNVILGGNMRYRAMQQLGYEQVEVVKVSGLTDEQKREFIIKDNVPFGDWDWEMLANKFDAAQLNEWGLVEAKPIVDVEEIDCPGLDEAAESEYGKIYQLGNNLLYCGSFADDELGKLFANRKADCTFTDPPYNVAVKSRSTGKSIQNDNMPESDFSDLLANAFGCVAQNTKLGGGVISWMSDKELLTLKRAMSEAGMQFKTIICWVKSQFTLGGGGLSKREGNGNLFDPRGTIWRPGRI